MPSGFAWRGTREVFDRTCRLCQSLCADGTQIGSRHPGQLGCPDRAIPKECPQILLAMLEREEDTGPRCDPGRPRASRAPEAIGPASRFATMPTRRTARSRFGLDGVEDRERIGVLIELTRDADATCGIGPPLRSGHNVRRIRQRFVMPLRSARRQ